jgi:hypothetical protein
MSVVRPTSGGSFASILTAFFDRNARGGLMAVDQVLVFDQFVDSAPAEFFQERVAWSRLAQS